MYVLAHKHAYMPKQAHMLTYTEHTNDYSLFMKDQDTEVTGET